MSTGKLWLGSVVEVLHAVYGALLGVGGFALLCWEDVCILEGCIRDSLFLLVRIRFAGKYGRHMK